MSRRRTFVGWEQSDVCAVGWRRGYDFAARRYGDGPLFKQRPSWYAADTDPALQSAYVAGWCAGRAAWMDANAEHGDVQKRPAA